MALHRLSSLVMGVPNPEQTSAFYTDFGLAPEADGWFSTRDGGRQLRIVGAPTRRLVEITVGVDTPDDLSVAAARLESLGVPARVKGDTLTAYEKVTGVRAVLRPETRLTQPPTPPTPYNGPGRTDRVGSRAPACLREERVGPANWGTRS